MDFLFVLLVSTQRLSSNVIDMLFLASSAIEISDVVRSLGTMASMLPIRALLVVLLMELLPYLMVTSLAFQVGSWAFIVSGSVRSIREAPESRAGPLSLAPLTQIFGSLIELMLTLGLAFFQALSSSLSRSRFFL